MIGKLGAIAVIGIVLGINVAVFGGGLQEEWPIGIRRSCNAQGDGRADDSGALKACLTRLQEAREAGAPAVLHIPAGIYHISGADGPMPTLSRGVTIRGDGPHATYIVLDRSYRGDLFSWSEAWTGRNYGPSYDPARDANGPTVEGLQITGTADAPATQTAFAFYDRNDHVLLRDVEVEGLNGPCLSIGHTRAMPQAYMRESAFYNVKCFSTGSDTLPAVEIGSTTSDGSDATNELDFYKLAIFDAKGIGLAIRNPADYSATRKLRFFGLRVEKTGGDAVAIGAEGDKGQIAEIGIYDLSVVQAGKAALRIGTEGGKQPYAIGVNGGLLGPGNHQGIVIDSGRLIDISLSALDAPVVLGRNAGTDISIHGNGFEYGWKYQGEKPPGSVAGPLNLRSPFGLYGLPSAGGSVGAAALKGSTKDDRPVRLTMDGKAPDAYNCFNPSYSQTYNLRIQLIAQDTASPAKWYAWTLPAGVFSAWTGPGSATLTSGTPVALAGGAEGARVALAADRANGCIDLSFVAPKGNADPWEVTALIDFARAP